MTDMLRFSDSYTLGDGGKTKTLCKPCEKERGRAYYHRKILKEKEDV